MNLTQLSIKTAVIAAAYLIGAIPFGFIIGKMHGVDIRTQGSCNIGATNVTRVIGRWWGKLCFLCDFCKGLLPVLAVVMMIKHNVFFDKTAAMPALTALAVVLGHIFPVYLKFKGGKGVATAAGALCAISYPAVITALLLWVVIFKAGGYVSLASIIAAGTLPLTVLAFGWLKIPPHVSTPSFMLIVLLAVLTIVKHSANIKRLANGTENRFSSGDKK